MSLNRLYVVADCKMVMGSIYRVSWNQKRFDTDENYGDFVAPHTPQTFVPHYLLAIDLRIHSEAHVRLRQLPISLFSWPLVVEIGLLDVRWSCFSKCEV